MPALAAICSKILPVIIASEKMLCRSLAVEQDGCEPSGSVGSSSHGLSGGVLLAIQVPEQSDLRAVLQVVVDHRPEDLACRPGLAPIRHAFAGRRLRMRWERVVDGPSPVVTSPDRP